MTRAAPAQGPIRPGARLGALEVVARLGAGGQGEVYLARPWAEGAARRAAMGLLLRVALRAGALTPGLAARHSLAALKVARSDMVDSLHDEHGHLAAPGAAHPHLVRLYRARFPRAGQPDLGLAPPGAWSAPRPCVARVPAGRQPDPQPASRSAGQAPRLYLALAYEAGAPLSLLLARCGRPPARGWSLAVATQVARALAHLHARGVVHHDVRPANIIVRRGPYAILADLGAAEVAGAPRRRAIYGASGWLAPERVGPRPAPASPLVDIYGVGALLLALSAGAAPPALARLIAEATAADPARRAAAIPSAEALLARLEELARAAART